MKTGRWRHPGERRGRVRPALCDFCARAGSSGSGSCASSRNPRRARGPRPAPRRQVTSKNQAANGTSANGAQASAGPAISEPGAAKPSTPNIQIWLERSRCHRMAQRSPRLLPIWSKEASELFFFIVSVTKSWTENSHGRQFQFSRLLFLRMDAISPLRAGGPGFVFGMWPRVNWYSKMIPPAGQSYSRPTGR